MKFLSPKVSMAELSHQRSGKQPKQTRFNFEEPMLNNTPAKAKIINNKELKNTLMMS